MFNLILPILLIVCPDSLQPCLTDYINYKSYDYEISVESIEQINLSGENPIYGLSYISAFDYVLLINAPILYDTVPIIPYTGIIASDRGYGDRVGRVIVANKTQLRTVLNKFMDFTPYRRMLKICQPLDAKTDGCLYSDKINLRGAVDTELSGDYDIYDCIEQFRYSSLIQHCGHAGAGGFGKIYTNEVGWFDNDPVFMYSMGCYSGYYPASYSLAVAGLNAPGCWAGFIGASNYQFYSVGTVGGASFTLDSLFWVNFSREPTVSDALRAAKDQLPATNPPEFALWAKAEMNLLGDPTLPTRPEFTLYGGCDGDTVTAAKDSNFWSRTEVTGNYYRFSNMEPGAYTLSVTGRSPCNSKDALRVLKYCVGLSRLEHHEIADVNQDHRVTPADALLIMRHFIDRSVMFPVESMPDTVTITRLRTIHNVRVRWMGCIN
jgi:hypothetical protein